MCVAVATVAIAGCAASQSNVVCNGNSRDMTCHQRTANSETTGTVSDHPFVHTGKQ